MPCFQADSSAFPEGLLDRPFDGRGGCASFDHKRASACFLFPGFSRERRLAKAVGEGG
jgi:hypothetical protein